ncbi:MAG: putative cytokinetic ring protein SteA [Bacillota bacterium]
MSDVIRGRIRKGRKTKQLIHRLRPGDVAVVAHCDLDSVVAEDLIVRGIRAVLNVEQTFTGELCTPGPQMILDAGIVILDGVEESVFDLPDGASVHITGDAVYMRGETVARGRRITSKQLASRMQRARDNLSLQLCDFVDNTLSFARCEKSLLLEQPRMPPLSIDARGRPALVAVRGRSYREDMRAIRTYVTEQNPVVIAVDGAADAVVEAGWDPDILLGDMDSVSDAVLEGVCRRGGQLIVHGYPDGSAPGKGRLDELGLAHDLFCVHGTSEDAALLLADQMGADLIVAVGTHTDPVEFLEKGRRGMASTMLVRLRVGGKLVDAKGVSRLYRVHPRPGDIILLMGAGLVPLLLMLWLSPGFNVLLRLLALHLRMTTGG